MTVVVYPYRRFEEDLRLEVSSLKLDFKDPEGDLLNEPLEIVNLYLAETEWVRASMKVTAVISEALPDFDDADDAQVTAIAYCTATNVRQAIRLKQLPDQQRWTGELTLDRAAFAEKVELYAVVTASVEGANNRLFGQTATWKVYFDKPAVPPTEGTLPVKWADFEDPDSPVPDWARTEPFFVALTENPPVVLLNEKFERLPDLLSEDDTRPASERALRDAEYRRIASAAWMQMFSAAISATEYNDDDDTFEWPEADWQRTTLEALLPEIQAGDLDDALRFTYNELRGDGHQEIQTRLQIAVSKQIGASKSLKKNLTQIVPA